VTDLARAVAPAVLVAAAALTIPDPAHARVTTTEETNAGPARPSTDPPPLPTTQPTTPTLLPIVKEVPQQQLVAKEQMMQNVREHSQQDRRVYVGNLSYDVKWHHLKDFMRQGENERAQHLSDTVLTIYSR
jgi:hypothetical protein